MLRKTYLLFAVVLLVVLTTSARAQAWGYGGYRSGGYSTNRSGSGSYSYNRSGSYTSSSGQSYSYNRSGSGSYNYNGYHYGGYSGSSGGYSRRW